MGLFVLDPVNGGDPFSGYSSTLPDIVPSVTDALTIPVAYLGETLDGSGGFMQCAPSDQNYTTFFNASAATTWAVEYTFVGADHMDFVSDTAGCGFTCSACRSGSADQSQVQASMSTLAAAFMRRHLQGEMAMDAYLFGMSVPSGVTFRTK